MFEQKIEENLFLEISQTKLVIRQTKIDYYVIRDFLMISIKE